MIGDKLNVYTVGSEWASPLRLNPFEILPGVAVGFHLDLLRSVFSASFGMWVPLPQVLERSLQEVYEDAVGILRAAGHTTTPMIDHLSPLWEILSRKFGTLFRRSGSTHRHGTGS